MILTYLFFKTAWLLIAYLTMWLSTNGFLDRYLKFLFAEAWRPRAKNLYWLICWGFFFFNYRIISYSPDSCCNNLSCVKINYKQTHYSCYTSRSYDHILYIKILIDFYSQTGLGSQKAIRSKLIWGREMERKKVEEYNHSSTCRNFQGHCWQRAGAYIRENWLVSGLKPIQSNPLYL